VSATGSSDDPPGFLSSCVGPYGGRLLPVCCPRRASRATFSWGESPWQASEYIGSYGTDRNSDRAALRSGASSSLSGNSGPEVHGGVATVDQG
jgi:hypothetical protein